MHCFQLLLSGGMLHRLKLIQEANLGLQLLEMITTRDLQPRDGMHK
jgi:hypothetical protein